MQQSAIEGAAARRVHIITDSASDLAAGEFPDVSVVPLTISFGNDSFEDGVNADLQATDYKKQVRRVDASTVVRIDMVRNGGWAAVIE